MRKNDYEIRPSLGVSFCVPGAPTTDVYKAFAPAWDIPQQMLVKTTDVLFFRPDFKAIDKMRQYAQMRWNKDFLSGRIRSLLNEATIEDAMDIQVRAVRKCMA